MILYELALSPFAQKIKIALREKGIAFESRLPYAAEEAERFAAVSPRREFPVLLDGEVAVTDSTTILDYLEEKWPEPALMPADPAGRARVRMLEELCDSQFEAINYGITEIVGFKRAEGEAAATILANAKDQTEQIFGYLDGQLGEQDYFSGDTFGRADIVVLPHANNAAALRNPPASDRLQAWLARVNERDSVAATVAEARDSLGLFKGMMADIKEGRAKRLYRDHRLEWMMRSGGLHVVLDGLKADNIRYSRGYR
jgi:glutathione S-transferase/RNA polymerase-associated protein